MPEKKSKKVKILLKERVLNFGKEGDIIETSRAHAMNVLIPQKKGELITGDKLKEIEESLKKSRQESIKIIEGRHKIAESLHMQELFFERKGNDKKVFGGIHELDIINEIKSKFKIKLNKSNIKLPDNHHIKKPGIYDVNIHIHEDTYIRVIINLKSI